MGGSLKLEEWLAYNENVKPKHGSVHKPYLQTRTTVALCAGHTVRVHLCSGEPARKSECHRKCLSSHPMLSYVTGPQ